MIEDDEAVVIGQRGSHKVAFKMHGAFGRRQFGLRKLVHDDDLGDSVETVILNGLAVVFRFHAGAGVSRVALHYVAFQAFDERPDKGRLKVMVVAGLASGNFDGHVLPFQRASQGLVGLHEPLGRDVVGEIDLG